MINKKDCMELIRKHQSENEFYRLLGETSDSFWEKFDNNMEYTSTQMNAMVKLLKIKNPTAFFYA